MFKKICFTSILLVLALDSAYAGKVQDLKAEITKACGSDVTVDRDEMIDLVRKVYLTCTPGRDVEIRGSCIVQCKKRNLGTVIGRSKS